MDPWVSLFSGGKDSSWVLYRALSAEKPVERLITVQPSGDSYLYHVPATSIASLAAESIGLPVVSVQPPDFDATAPTDESVRARGNRELEPLAETLTDLAETLGGIGGITAGAVASSFQSTRLESVCSRLNAELYTPLWDADPRAVLDAMLAAGFEITIVRVAARGLDEAWLGRTLDQAALTELERLHDEYGVHLLGEGGEFETLVTDGPHMDRSIEFDASTTWDGTRGSLNITNAWLTP